LLPWDGAAAVPRDAVEAVTASVPERAETVSPLAAAAALICSRANIYAMIERGTLLARRVGKDADPARRRWRVVCRLERPFDPNRRSLMTLEEAAKVFSNIGG